MGVMQFCMNGFHLVWLLRYIMTSVARGIRCHDDGVNRRALFRDSLPLMAALGGGKGTRVEVEEACIQIKF